MNSNYSNNQFIGFDNSQMNPLQVGTGSRMNDPYLDAHNTGVRSSNQHVNSHIVQDNFIINQLTEFIYRIPNEHCIYHIKCKEISAVQCLNNNTSNNFNQNKYQFYYQRQNDGRIFQIKCKIVSLSFIVNRLNKIYGFEIEQDIGYEELAFKFDQKELLRFHLTQYLDHFF
ncbi:hypothetical protein RclHR1_12170004 [Rhizophagus clarus]|uniref:Uncharacterized protein n=1 Tax=Rhizophagus clarus TaxID=94130 RepID=A0A2Z6QLK4_9GLOM|nr:hypothetical protein RclHR1_12170004 [Rhizophagus clarus]GES91852.1 hypothetical protein GLOIN_2v1768606 [Rhizophagus clarus]